MRKKMKNLGNWWNLRFVMFESAITSGLVSMSIMSLFYYSIGMSNEQIALSQSIFSIAMLFLDLPMGWVADRFGRKWSNVIGDFGEAIMFLYYATANSMSDVVLSECLLAVFSSLSAGVDGSLLRHFTQKIEPGERFFRSKNAKLFSWKYVVQTILVGLGGPLGAISYRLAIALSSVVYFIGGMVSLLIMDDSEKMQQQYKNPIKDLWRIIKESMKNKELRLRIFAQAIGGEMTHAMIWFFTPILILSGVPAKVVSIAWMLNSSMAFLGTLMAKRYIRVLGEKKKQWTLLAIPVILVGISMTVLSIKISIITVPFYLFMGFVQGWTSAALKPLAQKYARASEQTSILSLASTVGRLIYIPTGWIVGKMADIDLRLSALATLIIFIPVGIILVAKLRREEKN